MYRHPHPFPPTHTVRHHYGTPIPNRHIGFGAPVYHRPPVIVGRSHYPSVSFGYFNPLPAIAGLLIGAAAVTVGLAIGLPPAIAAITGTMIAITTSVATALLGNRGFAANLNTGSVGVSI